MQDLGVWVNLEVDNLLLFFFYRVYFPKCLFAATKTIPHVRCRIKATFRGVMKLQRKRAVFVFIRNGTQTLLLSCFFGSVNVLAEYDIIKPIK